MEDDVIGAHLKPGFYIAPSAVFRRENEIWAPANTSGSMKETLAAGLNGNHMKRKRLPVQLDERNRYWNKNLWNGFSMLEPLTGMNHRNIRLMLSSNGLLLRLMLLIHQKPRALIINCGSTGGLNRRRGHLSNGWESVGGINRGFKTWPNFSFDHQPGLSSGYKRFPLPFPVSLLCAWNLTAVFLVRQAL